jgi:hypothetical protein
MVKHSDKNVQVRLNSMRARLSSVKLKLQHENQKRVPNGFRIQALNKLRIHLRNKYTVMTQNHPELID